MNVLTHTRLAPYTSFECGGPSERLVITKNYDEVVRATNEHSPSWLLGFGCNVLISDAGLPGTTILCRGGQVMREENVLIADAGAWWDDVVLSAIKARLWGIELMSAIPGGVGAAVVGNIAAYGQAVADTLAWVEVYDNQQHAVRRVEPAELQLSYRFSALQTELKHLTILRAAFALSSHPTHEVTYQSALDAAHQNGFDIATLDGRRQTILKARHSAGSLWDFRDPTHRSKTAGSFFRNPLVSAEQAEHIVAFDETGKSALLIKQMNSVHGGDSLRVSAAHVLLAAGYKRGQNWGDVRLHPEHVQKIENTAQASAQDIYNVAHEIMHTVQTKLGISLVPEVRFLGEFQPAA